MGRESQNLLACDVGGQFDFAHASHSQRFAGGVVGLGTMSRAGSTGPPIPVLPS